MRSENKEIWLYYADFNKSPSAHSHVRKAWQTWTLLYPRIEITLLPRRPAGVTEHLSLVRPDIC